MAERVLTLKELNRTLLARQMLLERAAWPVPEALEQLGGLQAQVPRAPYIGLWTRLSNFRRADLAGPIQERTVVKATLMRATLHLVSASDYLVLRGALRPVLTEASAAIARQRGEEVDVEQVLAAGRQFLAEQPRTFAEITAMYGALMPHADPGATRYTLRTHLPLIQVPVTNGWSYPGTPKFALAEDWLGRPIPDEDNLRALVWRYLGAFGPATVADLQTWSGLGKLKERVETLRAELVTYHDERGRELLDLPGMPLPAGDTPAPERLLPEFDHLLSSHKDRTRVIAPAHHPKVYLPGLRQAPTFLVDGFAAGSWKIEAAKRAAILLLEPFDVLPANNREALAAEADNLLRFAEPEARTWEVRFVD